MRMACKNRELRVGLLRGDESLAESVQCGSRHIRDSSRRRRFSMKSGEDCLVQAVAGCNCLAILFLLKGLEASSIARSSRRGLAPEQGSLKNDNESLGENSPQSLALAQKIAGKRSKLARVHSTRRVEMLSEHARPGATKMPRDQLRDKARRLQTGRCTVALWQVRARKDDVEHG